MLIQPAVPAFVPKSLKKELLSEPKQAASELTPGLIVSTRELARQNPQVARALGGLAPERAGSGRSALVLPPRETSILFSRSEELALLKSVAGLIAGQIHPYVKTGVDVVWFVYKAAQLKEEWDRPDSDRVSCGFKMASLALDSARIAGSLYPDIKLDDAWANGFNFIVKSGDAIWQGKTAPVNELAFSTDKRLDIPVKLLKLAGFSLDPLAIKPNSLLGELTLPKIAPLPAAK